MRSTRWTCWRALLVLSLGLATGCSAGSATTPALQQLRIENSGSHDIVGLVILFPGATGLAPAMRVEFGDIRAGTTAEYRDVPSGVYRYAAYEYQLDGQLVEQPVVDWVGEAPMQGVRFTYRIQLDRSRPRGDQIQLIEVQKDDP